MENPVIQLNGVSKRYDDFMAVNDLNLSINKGEIFGLLGPNGAGKSTTILMLMGLTEPSSGKVEVCGINATVKPIEVKRKVGYLPEDVGFYDDRTGLENLIYTAQLNGIRYQEAKQKAEELLARVGLANDKNKKTGKYSKGMRQRLGLADVLIKNPEVIILDEPTSGIDPTGVQELLSLIVELRNERDITVLFSSHNLHQVQQVCDRVGIFVKGKLLCEGNIESLSEKLFTHGKYLIELGIEAKSQANKDAIAVEALQKVLSSVEDIQSIRKEKDYFQIECSTDNSSAIAKAVIDANYNLHFLNKKEYGLDAIYNRYFEGGANDETSP
ncbi:ABC-2 type transport system ATP-binding protein [Saccharicrinis carchari]|uniref:ABC-2 type transport system ATP-binding protein n=1 Tax=Saccharicrinis carchari TaxID=1168039 RepID=A0A521E7B5_SACCC|nr:ABC transporter ATP-binding protein [Saccharicrinis carchari]SMO79787.1 ABC-2 type transport system ATP-binding protein [Saccharicrinis carchari]